MVARYRDIVPRNPPVPIIKIIFISCLDSLFLDLSAYDFKDKHYPAVFLSPSRFFKASSRTGNLKLNPALIILSDDT